MALQDKNSEADFKENEKFVQFRQQLRELRKQCKSAASPRLLGLRAPAVSRALLYACPILRLNGLSVAVPCLSNSGLIACSSLKANSFHKVSHCWELGKQNKPKNHFIKITTIVSKHKLLCQALQYICSHLLLWAVLVRLARGLPPSATKVPPNLYPED